MLNNDDFVSEDQPNKITAYSIQDENKMDEKIGQSKSLLFI